MTVDNLKPITRYVAVSGVEYKLYPLTPALQLRALEKYRDVFKQETSWAEFALMSQEGIPELNIVYYYALIDFEMSFEDFKSAMLAGEVDTDAIDNHLIACKSPAQKKTKRNRLKTILICLLFLIPWLVGMVSILTDSAN